MTIEQRLQTLDKIDEIILADSKTNTKEYDRFRSLVNQKAGINDAIKRETGKTPCFTTAQRTNHK